MKIKVLRNACCAADDQLGPLTMDVELDGLMPLRALVDLVLESDFLQYSSSHTSMVGYVDKLAVVRVHSPDYSKEETQFLVNPKLPIQEAVASGSIDFRF